MIYIEKNNTNLIALTLLENAIALSNNFLFVFENDFTKQQTIINKTAIINNQRYTGFQFIDGTDEEINLRPGQYTYTVYLNINGNIDPLETIQKLETGRMQVVGEWLGIDPVYQ